MKLFKKILSTALSFGIIFSSALSLRVFAVGDDETSAFSTSEIPTNLKECCLELDKILSQEEKDKIKQSPVNKLSSYLRGLNHAPLGEMIRRDWLYLPRKEGKVGPCKKSTLYALLFEHGADFYGDAIWTMVNIILDNYRHYLLTGESVESIEDLAIDFWFNRQRCFDPSDQRERYEEMMERG